MKRLCTDKSAVASEGAGYGSFASILGIDGSQQVLESEMAVRQRNDGIQEPIDGITVFPAPGPSLPVESRSSDHPGRQLTFVRATRDSRSRQTDTPMLEGDPQSRETPDIFRAKVIARELTCSA